MAAEFVDMKPDKTVERLREILELAHLCILLPTVFPAVYLILLERDDSFIFRLLISGLVIVLPVVVVRVSIRRIRGFLPCLILFASAGAGVYGLAKLISSAPAWPEDIATGYMVTIMIETVVVVLSGISIRLRDNARKRARAQLDFTWKEQRCFLEKPGYFILVWFVFLYLLSLTCKCPTGCNIAIAGLISYACITCLHSHVEQTERYIGRLDYISRFPKRRVRIIGVGVVLTFMLLAGTAAVVVSVSTAGVRSYLDLRQIRFQRPPVEEYHEIGELGERPPLREDLFYGSTNNPYRPAPAWVNAMLAAIGCLIGVGVVLLVIRWYWHFCNEFRDTGEENGDISERITDEPGLPVMLRRIRRPAAVTERDRIRANYRWEIRKRRKDIPKPHETPSEIESETDLFGTEAGNALHVRYESARYDPDFGEEPKPFSHVR